MTIKTPTEVRIVYRTLEFLVIIVLLYINISLGQELKRLILFWGGCDCLALFSLFLMDYSACRTFIMNKDGCTSKYLFYKKHYKWEDLKFKKYVIYDCALPSDTYCRNYFSGAVFSRKYPKKYQSTRRRFTLDSSQFIAVSFPVKRRVTKNIYENYPREYPVDEHEFRKKMEEWGVELESAEVPNWLKKHRGNP